MAKRSYHGHRKQVAVKPTKDPATIARYDSNASVSPLLRLPLELRTKIWRYAVGDQVIHVLSDRLNGFSHEVCNTECFTERRPNVLEADINSEPNNESSTDLDKLAAKLDGPPIRESWEDTHRSCLGMGRPPFAVNIQKLTLGVLGVSRQVYFECFDVFWSTNQFSIDDPYTLPLFLISLRLSQKVKLRNLQLTVIGSSGFWSLKMTQSQIRLLRGLRNLHLCFAETWVADDAQDLSVLLYLQELSLEHVIVTVKLSYLEQQPLDMFPWVIRTQKQKKEIETKIRSMVIMGHNDAASLDQALSQLNRDRSNVNRCKSAL